MHQQNNKVMESISLVEAISRIRNGSMTCREYCVHLWKIWNQTYLQSNFYTDVIDKQSLESLCNDVDKAIQSGGSLPGIPFVIKANIDSIQFTTTAATKGFEKWYADKNAPILQKLLEAGGILVAKANMHEFAMGITSKNRVYGDVRNPYNRNAISGGSSGGSAACVASGCVPFSLGSDTAGSVRIPAALCGCVGFRPTTHKYSQEGVIPLCATTDTIGIMTRSVTDVEYLHNILYPEDKWTLEPLNANEIRIGVPNQYFFDDIHEKAVPLVEGAIDLLCKKGASIIRSDHVVDVDKFSTAEFSVVAYESLRELGMYLITHNNPTSLLYLIDQISDAKVKYAFKELHPSIKATTYHESLVKERPKLQHLYHSYFERTKATVMMIPTTLLPACSIDVEDTITLNGKQMPVWKPYLHNTYPSSFAGLPSISIPCGFIDGLPFGIEFVAPVGNDSILLQVAKLYENLRGPFPLPNI